MVEINEYTRIPEFKQTLEAPHLTSEEETLIEKSKGKKSEPQQKTKSKFKFSNLLRPFKRGKSKPSRPVLTAKKSQQLLRAFAFQRQKPVKRKLTPRELVYLKRLKQLKAQRGMSNLNLREVVYSHDKDRERILRESALRNLELSPNTRAMLERVREIQTRGFRQDDKQQRILRERRIIQNATDILRTPNLFTSGRGKLDFTGVNPEENILFAPNVFKEDQNNFILRPRSSSILSTAEAGNNLIW